MIKTREIDDQGSCLNRAADDEPLFVLLGRDVAAPMAILEWIATRIELGKNAPHDPQIVEACHCVATMLSYQRQARGKAKG